MFFDKYTDLVERYRRPLDRRNRGGAGTPYSATTGRTTATSTPRSVPFSPELETLKHSPYDLPVGLSGRETQDVINLGRENIQSSTDIAMEQMREKLGSKGFRAGESGIADTILGGIAKEGQKQLSTFSKETTMNERMRRFQEHFARAKLGLEREGFEYGQERDLLNSLMSMFGMGMQGQQARWQPYWQGLTESYR